jgi:agmatinase
MGCKPFLYSEIGRNGAEESLFHVFPAPYEKSVSYGGGTRKGPAAIMAASDQLELPVGEVVPAALGIHTHKPLTGPSDPRKYTEKLASVIQPWVNRGKIPVVLGGEHTVTLGPVQALLARPGSAPFGIIQFDAHADLRNTYEGSLFSHACVMRRIREWDVPLYQIGVRGGPCAEEKVVRAEQDIGYLDGEKISLTAPLSKQIKLPADFPDDIYISFDVDGLDPSVMPATGTPVPGGLFWNPVVELLDWLGQKKRIIGFDVVEFAPIKGLHHADFTAAALVYRLMAAAGV